MRDDPGVDLASSRLKDLLLLARATGLLLLLPLLLRCFSIPGLLRRLAPAPRPAADPPRDPAQLVGVLAGLLGSKLLRVNCLRRSLVLFYFLARYGHPARIRFGVSMDGGDLAGHSWIELSGEPFAESDPHPSFRVIYSFPEEAQRRASHDQTEEPFLETYTHPA